MKLNITPMHRDDLAAARGISQQVAAPIPGAVPATTPASSGRMNSEELRTFSFLSIAHAC